MSHQHAFKNNVGFIKINMRFTNIYNHKFMVETKRVWYSSNIRNFFFEITLKGFDVDQGN